MSADSSTRAAIRSAGTLPKAFATAVLRAAIGVAALQAGVWAAELLGPSGVRFPTGPSPDDVAIADFDADGAPDLAITNMTDGTVSILLGDGDGGFFRVQDLTVGASPESLAAADLDANGVPDLVAVNRDDNSVSVARGRGDGRFDSVTEIPDVGAAPVDVAVADLDGDGTRDLAVVLRDASAVSILRGDGTGGFGAPETTPGLGPFPISIATADFDADGDVDLAVANVQGDSVSVLLGDGAGDFSPPAHLPVGSFPVFVTTGDFDANGAPDLAVLNGDDASVSVLLGRGDGGFDRQVPDIAVGQFPIAAVVGDLDADGTGDLIVTNLDDNSVSVLLGDGQGGFVRRCRSTEGGVCTEVSASSPRSLALGDLDRDGAPDLAIASQAGGSVTILLGDGLGGLTGAPETSVDRGSQAVVAADLNADGAPDLAVANTLGDSVAVLLNDGSGGFAPGPDIDATFAGPVALAPGDFDRDGDLDLAVANFDATSGHIKILLGDGTGAFAGGQDLTLAWNLPGSLAAGDFDGDGRVDLVVVHATRFLVSRNRASILLGRGDGTFVAHASLQIQDDPGVAGVGDLDGDGDLDLAITNFLTRTLRVFLGEGDGTFVPVTPDINLGDAPTSIAVHDLDRDGDLDLAVPLFSQRRVAALLGRGDGRFDRRVPDVQVGDGPRAVAVADFNDDGLPDLTVSHAFDDSIGLLLGSGDGGFVRAADFNVGNEPLGIAVADFDRDDAPDLAVANRLDDSVTTLFNQLAGRADLNGSNRVDGFDVAAIGRLMGALVSDAAYRRSADVDLNGVIDGDDLSLATRRFGRLNRTASPLRAALMDPLPPLADTVTLQQEAVEGDLLRVRVLVNDSDDAASAADFAVSFGPDDGAAGQVVEIVGYDPGTYLAGGAGQMFGVDARAPGRAQISAIRFPPRDVAGAGAAPLMDLFFRARRTGTARLAFGPLRRPLATLLYVDGCPDPGGCDLPGVTFATAAVRLRVDDSAGGPPGRKIGFSPALLDFGEVTAGSTARRALRISNFGFSELQVSAVTPDRHEFTTSFACGSEAAVQTCSAITIPPFGFVELPVVFAPQTSGVFTGELRIESDDSARPVVSVPVLGRSDPAAGAAAIGTDR